MNKAPAPRVDKKRKLVCVYSTKLGMYEVRAVTNKGAVSKVFAAQVAFTQDIREAFRRFSVPLAGFKAVHGVRKEQYKSWNEYIEGVWNLAK